MAEESEATPTGAGRRRLAGALTLILLGSVIGFGVAIYSKLTPQWLRGPDVSPPSASAAVPPGPVPSQSAPPPVESIPVNVNARPWARIEVDGVEAGLTPLAGLALEPGLHRFRATMSDGTVLERVETIAPDRRRVVFP